jgi:hypothetical protein
MKSPLHYIDPILTVQGNAPINNYEFSELLGNSMVLRTANTLPIAAKLIFFNYYTLCLSRATTKAYSN